ncbi:lytic transglycosylase domain-containing protein [Chelativorans salis]|uniref:Lytic transglycosylase domain-containing protein n=1 Tax=Chelativorans salis TaxID=2978478 RepID=A0ABT2LS39_9HYPH|nr:lytic transglycosylase domain-containing protein [Chelativorans sp. EGI FJ00035]MCT7375994.1 lytic transglycosylase domain-containing protein [Chelativorans sp. EGI FJ00035]
MGAQAGSLPGEAPLPTPRPYAPLDKAAMAASLPFVTGILNPQGDLALLKQGLQALSKGDVSAARRTREALKERSLDHAIMGWAIALSNARGVRSREIAEITEALPGWPGMARLRANSERALYRENLPPSEVIAAFGGKRPATYEGTIALARAHTALGDEEAARGAVLSPFWRSEKLELKEEMAILKEFGGVIPAADHRHRMERMLYGDRIRSAERVAKRAGGEALTRAWAAVIRNQREAGKLLDAVPESERTAGYVFAKARYLRRTGKFHEAAEVMRSAPRDVAKLVDPDVWWFERRVLSRELLDIGEAKTAYRIAAAHVGGSRTSKADAEFHAGWYALRYLDDAETAARHFARIADIADGPISRARAFYWLGRAAEAGGPGDAEGYYQQAAAYGTAFYGQLAAAKLDRSILDAAHPEPTDLERRQFAGRRIVQAIRRLEAADQYRYAGILYRDLAEELSSTGELTLLAAMAESRDNHYLALRIGKAAASRGLEIGMLAHPVGAIPASASVSDAGKALAYAIARQESEFNTGAVSSAGARGLLQLMPGTAKAMARKAGLAYSAPRLTTDAGYNTTLGSAYLSEQLGRFDGSYILTFVGYNAGPRRAQEWIKRYGDPRGAPIDEVVDWIERIPFTETRHYVQRVMENYQVYKMRLTGRFDIEKDLVEGR